MYQVLRADFGKYFMKLQSLRSKLLVGFLGYSLLGIGIVALALWNVNKTSRINELATRIDGLIVHCFELLSDEQAFFNDDLIDPDFFISGTSRNLERHRIAFQEVTQGLINLKTDPNLSSLTISGRGVNNYLDRINIELDRYGESFLALVDLNKERGFKDFGLVGDMRMMRL